MYLHEQIELTWRVFWIMIILQYQVELEKEGCFILIHEVPKNSIVEDSLLEKAIVVEIKDYKNTKVIYVYVYTHIYIYTNIHTI